MDRNGKILNLVPFFPTIHVVSAGSDNDVANICSGELQLSSAPCSSLADSQ